MHEVPPRPDAQALLGRTAELTLLGDFVGRACARGDALLTTGGPGVGKSALLEAAARMAAEAGARVLRATGVQFETEISFAGLNQLFLPLQDRLPELPHPHGEALSSALGVGGEPADGQLVVSAAAL